MTPNRSVQKTNTNIKKLRKVIENFRSHLSILNPIPTIKKAIQEKIKVPENYFSIQSLIYPRKMMYAKSGYIPQRIRRKLR